MQLLEHTYVDFDHVRQVHGARGHPQLAQRMGHHAIQLGNSGRLANEANRHHAGHCFLERDRLKLDVQYRASVCAPTAGSLTGRQCGRSLSREAPVVLPETATALALLPPWLVIAALLGVINGAASFMLIGRHLSGLAWYALLGIFA